MNQDGDDRNVIILFHNLKGYDGMFLLQYMYAHHREVKNLVTVGVKVLSFVSDRLTFKDSLCFLPFSLSSFPATFGIRELSKGFFPHLFNTSENQSYCGPMREIRYYDPDGMSTKKRDEFMRWHAERVAEGYEFDLQRDMQMYCESDVKLLKAGCQKFVDEFKIEADFDPMQKCITIASACNRYWRKCQTVSSLRHYVAKLYAEYRTEHRTRVAYKGGTVEKLLLVSMNIPFLNLETLGCPKYDVLRALDNEPPETCGWHAIPNKHHCAMTECRAFFHWY